MQYIKGIDAFREEKRTAVTLGKFDGLHRGHQKLIEKIRSYAGNDCVSVVCAFDMQRSCLMTKEERKKSIKEEKKKENPLRKTSCCTYCCWFGLLLRVSKTRGSSDAGAICTEI